ncbi:MAG: BlaI/MecI/CopY family transcriptional regulator [Blautia wexlerae]
MRKERAISVNVPIILNLRKKELAHKYATDFVDNTFNGSISNLLVSLTYKTKLSESDIEELKNIINNNLCEDSE